MNNNGNRKKIVFVINNFFVGGAQYQLLRQFRYYDFNRYEVHLCVLIPDAERTDLLTELPTQVTVHTLHFKSFFDVASWIAFYKLLKQMRPNLVISSLYFSNTVVRILKLALGYPVIAREHNMYFNKTALQILVDRILSYASVKLIAVSYEVADFAAKQAGIKRDKFLVVENGIDLTEVDQHIARVNTDITRKSFGFQEHNIVFLHVGRLVSQKNQLLLIQGFLKFNEKHTNARLLIVGGGAMEEELKQLVEAHHSSNAIVFAGEQSNVHPYYQIADAFISTSLREGMSNTHLEAAAHGVPLVTTRTGGTSSIIEAGVNGVYIETETVEAVEAALELATTLDLRVLKQNMWNGRGRFDIKNAVQSYNEIFETYAR